MSKRVLVIEDNDQNMYLLRYILQEKGYEVIGAKSGAEGMQLVRQYTPDLVLLDIQLPEMDGYEVANQLRKQENVPNTPIIAVTSYAMPGDREKALDAGCSGYIEKPIKPNTFFSEIEEFL